MISQAIRYRTAAGLELTQAGADALVKSAKIDFAGDDFSAGAFTLSNAAGSTGCPADGALDLNDAKDALSATMTGVGQCVLAMDATANAAAEAKGEDFAPIQAQTITADLAVTLSTANPAYPFDTLADQPAGEIKRDGTTVQLPYLTTAPGYAQQLVLVNRGIRAAAFWLDGLASDGAAPTSEATARTPMTIDKDSRRTVAIDDLVDLGTGATQGSATLSINASSANVDVLTILTNQSTGSTDTLQHEPVQQ